MKTKIKRHSRAVMSVILAVSMLISCMTVGLIATDAAKVTDDEALGAATYYLYYRTDNTKSLSGMTAVQMTASGSNYVASFTMPTGNNFDLGIGTSSTPSSTMVTSSWTVNEDSGINFANIEENDGIRYIVGSVKTSGTVTVTYTPSSTISLTTAGGGSTGSNEYCLTGDSAITGTSGWTNNTTTNKLTYNSTSKIYTITKTVSYTSGTFNFRITNFGSWTNTFNFEKANLVNTAGIATTWQAQPNSTDKNIQMQLSQAATIEIRLDDSKSDTSAVTVIVTPTTSTVTAAVSPANSGTATVNGVASATATYGGTVSLSATAANYYVFKNWTTTNNKVSIAGSSSASTTASVYGTDTVTANFDKTSYTVSRGTGGTGDTDAFTITTPSANQSKQWDTSVSVTANSTSDLYYVDYLYYKVNNAGSEVRITNGAAGSGASTTLSGSFTMPKNNVTVYAHTHKRETNDFTYGYVTGCEGMGYINVGKQHDSSTSQIEYSIDSPGSVIEGTTVLFGARAVAGKKFVGWFSDQAGNNAISGMNVADKAVTNPTGTYYAKFQSFAEPEAGKIKLLVRSATNAKEAYWCNGASGTDIIEKTTANSVTYGGYTCYLVVKEYAGTETDVIIRDSDSWTYQTIDLGKLNPGKTYFIDWDGTGKRTGGTFAEASAVEYPVKLTVNNPDLGAAANGSTGAYTDNYFVAGGSNAKIYAQPEDDDNNKTRYQLVSGTTNVDVSVTDTSKTGAMVASAEALNATITYVPKAYYTVKFSAGAGGTVSATAGGADITSGTKVKEGTSVTITATPKSGYSFKGWGGDSSSTTSPLTFSSLDSDKTVKAYFSVSKGTSNTKTYFGYGTNSTGVNIKPTNWTAWSSTYVRDGHVFAYIDSVTANNYYFISAYTEDPGDDDEKKNTKQYYRKTAETTQISELPYATTEFPSDITGIGRYKWGSDSDKNYDGINYYVRFKVSADVEGVIVDLGPNNGGVAQTHQGDGNHHFDANCYRIIPIYNKAANKVTVYAKDGSYRFNSDYDKFPAIADTVITTGTYVTNRSQQGEFETAVATKGQSITVTTTIDSTNNSTYYVKGFSVNGVTPELYKWNSNGVYSMTYNIPADFDDDYLEITPIYYYKHAADATGYVQFYIENYDNAFQDTGWGNTLSVYPFYNDLSGKDCAFGGYPGQPVINYGGRRFVEIPTTYSNKTIQGVTLSNDYFDIVHRDYCREVDDHLQTYDYDDFYKIYKETSDGQEVNGKTKVADQITFAFKHRITTNNFSDNATTQTYSDTGKTNVPAPYSSFAVSEKDTKFKNGWEPLLDYHDRPVDLFGKQLSLEDQQKEPLLVVSDDYAITYAGRYATTWTVYRKNGSNYTKIEEIAPSALIVATQARLGTSTYPAVTDKTGYPSTDGHKLADYSDEYQALKAYANTPVQITYEQAIRNKSDYPKHWSMSSGSSEVSKRSDGRWFYSYMNEVINANLRIDYGDEDYGDNYDSWSHDTFKTGTNTGVATGATVHFTNDGTAADDGGYDLSPYHNTADYDGTIYSNFNNYYKFVATEGSGYIFMGWYMDRDGIQTAVTPDNVKQFTGKSQMTSNATFVARYVKNPAGHLTIKHTIADGSTGAGTTYIKIEKSTDGSTWNNVTSGTDGFVRQDAYSINDTDVMSYNSGYILKVTLKTEVDSDTAFKRFSASDATGDHSSDYFSNEVTTVGNTSTTSFEIPVNDLFELVGGFPQQKDNYDTFTYFSHTEKKPELTISHNLDATSDASATGTTYLKVEVTSDTGSHVAWINDTNTDVYETGKNLVVPSTYFNSSSGYRLKIYLKTEMTGFTQFDYFSILGEVLGNHASLIAGASVQITDDNSMHTKLATIAFPIADLFNNGEPKYTELPYLSRLIMPDYKYQIKYTYPSYLKNNDGTYSQQSYTTKGSFAPEDLNTYMSLTNNDLAFKTDADKKTFACSKAPYEDNFQKKLDWSLAAFGDRTYTQGTHTLTLQVTLTEAQQQTLSVAFNFPYATDTANSKSYEVVERSDNKIAKTDSNLISRSGIYGRDWFVIRGARNKTLISTDGNPVYVKAPLIIYDDDKNTPSDLTDDTPYYFKYWSVKTEAKDGEPSVEFTRCYDYEFNLAIFQNCVVEPLYDTVSFETRGMINPPTTYDGYSRYDADVNRQRYSAGENGVSITFLENSRNQWNNNDGGSNDTTRHGAGDRIYSDFLLTFDNNPLVKLQDTTANTKQAGLIIQPVALLESDGNGGYTVQNNSYYSSALGYEGATPAQIKDHLEGRTQVARLQRSKFDVRNLDNKNRIQYYYGIDNAAAKATGATADSDGIIRVGNTYNNQKVVYKAFAYIGDGTANSNTLSNVVVSSQPIYFTIYTDATIAPGFYMPSTSGSGS